MIAPLLAGFPISDPQTWVVTLAAGGVAVLLVRRWIGPRKGKSGCSSCGPTPPRRR